MMIYGSVCSGIEAATVAWEPLGWRAAWFAEIDPFACHVLAARHGASRPRVMPSPDDAKRLGERRARRNAIRRVIGLPEHGAITNHGDFTQIQESEPIDVLVGGTPCQSFSVAGLRKGLGDDRGNLALEFLRLAGRIRPSWMVWENVPGVLSIDDGRAFGSFLGGLGQLGYGFAYRILDAQFVRVDGFGRAVPQRRRRVFVIGHLGDWRAAAAVLFDRESLHGNTPPSREARQDSAGTLAARADGGGGLGTDFELDGGLVAKRLRGRANLSHRDDADTLVAKCLTTGSRIDAETETLVALALTRRWDSGEDGAGRGTPLVPVAFSFDERQITSEANRTRVDPSLPCGTLHALPHSVAFQERGRDGGRAVEWQEDVAYSLNAPNGGGRRHEMNVATRWAVRRLTPRECERLQGFPDDYTLVPYRGKPAHDSPRYASIGNSMAVNVMRWIGRRIELVESIDNGGNP